jgi:2-keto-4-pentenoate hydratase
MVDLEAVAESIWSSAERGMYYPAEWRGQLSLDEAYRVQLAILARYLRAGEVQAGWKVGLTARAMQVQQGVHEPVFGFLLQSGARPSGAVLQFAELIQPGFENELCLTIGTTLRGPGVTLEAAQAATAAVAPALEIVERRGDLTGQLALALADNAQQKAFVTGPATTRPADGFRLSEATVEVVVNGQSVERAGGVEVLGDPAASVAWLANKLAEFQLSLAAGQQVMSGSFTRQYLLAAGDRVEARFAPFGTVSVEVR